MLEPVSSGVAGTGIQTKYHSPRGASFPTWRRRRPAGPATNRLACPRPSSPTSNSKSSLPTRMWSPPPRTCSPRTRALLTKVPLVLPRSRTRTAKSSTQSAQWWRLTSSLLGRRWQSCSRPIRNLRVANGMILPWCLPPTTFNFACSIELELRPTNWPAAESFGRVQIPVLVAATLVAPDAGTLTSRRSVAQSGALPELPAFQNDVHALITVLFPCANTHVCDNERPVCIGCWRPTFEA